MKNLINILFKIKKLLHFLVSPKESSTTLKKGTNGVFGTNLHISNEEWK